jgi:cytochrome c-type biogenesis protein CcmH/NrfG
MVSAAFDWVWQMPVLPVALLLLAAAVLIDGEPRDRGTGSRERADHPAQRRPLLLAIRAMLIAAAIAGLLAIGVPLAATNDVRQSQADFSAGDQTAALAAARSAARIEPGAATPRIQEALVLESMGAIPSALSAAGMATRDEPLNWQAWLVLSRLEAEDGHSAAAVTAYRRARTLNPRSPLFRR